MLPPILAETRGILPTPASFMLDVVFIAMFAIVPLLLLSIALVKYGRRYQLHKWLQIGMAVVLLLAVVAFEVDMRFFTDWEAYAVGSPFYEPEAWNLVWYSLIVHLCFAVPTPFLWAYVIVMALRRFQDPPQPGKHSSNHKTWGWIASAAMLLTAVTGWVFYTLAFVIR